MPSRRSFLSRAGLAAAGLGAAPHMARPAETLLAANGQRPQKIIFVVSDGMSQGTLTCADLLSHRLRKRGLTWMQMYKRPEVHYGYMNTRSLDSLVTDSAAAASAWGSGSRVANGAINMLPNGKLLTPLYDLFAQQSWKRGLVTTAEVTHATPAGFAVNVNKRGDGVTIAAQYLERKVEVLLGGARPHFDPRSRKDKRDLFKEFAAAGYAVVQDKAALAAAPLDKPLLGTFAEGHLPYTIDHLASDSLQASTPTLAEMTAAALARLGRHPNFILQVEGARIDHAAHNSDAPAALRDQIALDEALDLCLAYQNQNPDTLVVVTTDHANSNLGLNGMGSSYRSSPAHFAYVADVKASYPEILKRLEKLGKKSTVAALRAFNEESVGPKEAESFTGAVKTASSLAVDPKDIQSVVEEATGYKVSVERASLLARVMANDYRMLYDQMNPVINQFGQLMANRLGIGWTGNTHTGDYVTLLARGPGAEHFRGFIDNTEVFGILTRLAGIRFQNPSLPHLADQAPADAEHAEAYAWA
jgi:alkaline phosphatase